MIQLGAHMSIAGGYHKAVARASAVGCRCLQIFTKNTNQWRAREIPETAVASFRAALEEHQMAHPIAHASYLINLASPDRALWKKSVDAMVVELQRADRLGIPYVIVHPGAYTSSSEARGIQAIGRALNEIHRQTRDLDSRCLLETTAGQGTCLGCTFEQIAKIIDRVRHPERVAICFDTCHVFAAGYPLGTMKDYRHTMHQFDRIVGIRSIRAVHLNDSKAALGSRVDRHEHIGKGHLGKQPFENLLNDPRFRKVPMYLETPKETRGGKDCDMINLRTLRKLIRP